MKSKIITGTVTIVLYFLLFHFYAKKDFIYTTGSYILQKDALHINMAQIGIDFYRTAVGFLGALSMVIILKLVTLTKIWPKESFFTKGLVYLGRNTMGIYIWSILFNEILLHLQKDIFRCEALGTVASIFEAILIIVLTLGIVNLLKQKKITSKLFLGI